MRLVADGVYLLNGFPPGVNAVNVYIVDDVLVDAGWPWSARRVLRQIETRDVNTHVTRPSGVTAVPHQDGATTPAGHATEGVLPSFGCNISGG